MNHIKSNQNCIGFAEMLGFTSRAFGAHGYCEVEFTYVCNGDFCQNRIDSWDYAPNRLNGSIDVQD